MEMRADMNHLGMFRELAHEAELFETQTTTLIAVRQLP